MTASIAVIVPVLGRPQNAQPLVDSFTASVPDAELVFVASRSDHEQRQACLRAGKVALLADWEPEPGDYARKIQLGYESTGAPYVLCGADDLRFHPGWDAELLRIAEEFDVGVIGTNDLGNQQTVAGRHSTHPLVARCYIDERGGYVGGEGRVYFDGYDHQMVDLELIQTAQARGCYAHAHRSVVEHAHYLWRKAPDDDTYRKGRRATAADRRLFESRRQLWEREQVPA